MDADLAQLGSKFVVVGGDHTAIAGSTEVLGGKKTEAAEIAERSGHAAMKLSTDGLGRIFDDRDTVVVRQSVDLVERRGLSKEVDRDDGFGARGDGRSDLCDIDVEGDGIDIDEHRLGAEQSNRSGGGNEGEGDGDDFIAGSDAEGHEREQDGVGAGGAANGMFDSDISRDRFLEGLHLGAENEVLGGENATYRRLHFRLDLLILRTEIEKRELQERPRCENELISIAGRGDWTDEDPEGSPPLLAISGGLQRKWSTSCPSPQHKDRFYNDPVLSGNRILS